MYLAVLGEPSLAPASLLLRTLLRHVANLPGKQIIGFLIRADSYSKVTDPRGVDPGPTCQKEPDPTVKKNRIRSSKYYPDPDPEQTYI